MAWLQSAIPFIGIILLFQKTTAENLFLLQASQRYHLITDSLTWYEAQSFCRVKHADLATVNNMNDQNELHKTLGGRATWSWIGLLSGQARRWMWSDGRGTAHFTKWDDGEPSYDDDQEWCGEISQTTRWNDAKCGVENDFVCYERQPFNYVHYKDGESWEASQELCRRRHTDLACVTTSTENSEIANSVKSWTGVIGFNNKAWFGLFNDAWMWSDGRQTSFRYWQSGQPNGGGCAAVSEQGRWVDINCHSKAAFVCQGGLKVKKMVIRMKVRSDADLTDSAVSDAILKELETRLKDRFVTDFNVRWRSDKNRVIFQRQEQQEVAKKTGTRLFHYINTSKRWSEAQDFCRVNYAGLVTLNNMGEHVQLVQSIPDADVSGVWIETERWVWSEGVGEVDVFRWEIGKEHGDCTQMETNGRWFANQCSALKAFLCFECDSQGLESYFLYTQPMSWRDAQRHCRQNHTDLVSVKTKEQNVEIHDQAKNNAIWIGLIREGWMWSDGSQTSFRNWDESSPDNEGAAQNCVAILKSLQHQWDDSACNVSYPFFCQGQLKTKTTVVKVRISSGVNLENERESLLKQIQAQLEAQGLTGVKVRWRTDANNQIFKEEKDDGTG